MRVLVLKITGKAFDAGSSLVIRYANIIRRLLEEHKLIVIAGGGEAARRYISLARDIGVKSNYWLDMIGIHASRLNALLLISYFQGRAYPKPVESPQEALDAIMKSDLVVSGGLIPAQSTASVALELAEAVGAGELFYFSAIGYVYDRDPRKYSDARPFKEIAASELKSALQQRMLPGEYALIDEKALDIALRSGIRIQLIPFEEPERIFEALGGGNPGTLIRPE